MGIQNHPFHNAREQDLNPATKFFEPASPQHNGVESQEFEKEKLLIPEFLMRLSELNKTYQTLRGELEQVKMAQSDIVQDVNALKEGSQSVHVGAVKAGTAVTEVLCEIGAGNPETKNLEVANPGQGDIFTSADDATVIAPVKSALYLPPHQRYKANATGDATAKKPNASMASHEDNIKAIQSIEDPYVVHSGKGWVPLTVSNFRPLEPSVRSQIPSSIDMVTFSPDFLANEIAGIDWSPGLNFVPNGSAYKGTLRSYYTLDPKHEPYLPKEPGMHGAKLTAFFNRDPADFYPEAVEGCMYENVPMFMSSTTPAGKTRYTYFGHYSQPRWSDKLDYDRLVEQVPHTVKEHWAGQLAAVGRPEWVTEALMDHFWPKPEYLGRIALDGDGDEDEEAMQQGVAMYMKRLKYWKKAAQAEAETLTKDRILADFERSDADAIPGLRLWWEYLECVNWDADFYNYLVQTQGNNPNYV